MRPALVIFDCDGVLVDSEPLSNGVLAELLTALGYTVTAAEATAAFLGRTDAECFAIASRWLGRPLPAEFESSYRAEVMRRYARELRAVAGVADALGGLAAPVCVASNSETPWVREKLRVAGLLDRFEGRIFSVSDVDRPKPHPDLFLHAARCLGARPDRTVVIEDSVLGVRAARAAGMTALAYAERTDSAGLARAGAHAVFDDMRRLPGLIASLGGWSDG